MIASGEGLAAGLGDVVGKVNVEGLGVGWLALIAGYPRG